MKKIIALFWLIFSMMSLVSCHKKDFPLAGNEKEEDNSSIENQISPLNGKAVVVYFSATNNTRRISNVIANYLNISTFELVPVQPYTSSDLNYNDSNSRVSKEHYDLNRHIELNSTTIPEFDSLSYIFIGYPIWWGEESWVIDDFVLSNDFSGKIVIPFATSASSPLGTSAKNLATKASGGNWLDGIRFSSSANEQTITSWVDQLKLFITQIQ